MDDRFTGSCRCGEVRYTLAIPALPLTYACHCHQCQKWSGSAFSLQAMVPEASLAITGPVVTYEKVTEDRLSLQRICGVCHARLYNTNTRRPGIAVVRAGTLDGSEALACVAHIYTRHKQAWFALPDDVPNWPDAPPRDAFMAALRG